MNNRRLNPWLQGLLALSGLALVGLAVFAQALGIDHNAQWGRGRFFLLGLGVSILAGLLAARNREPLHRIVHEIHALLAALFRSVAAAPPLRSARMALSRAMARVRAHPAIRFLSRGVAALRAWTPVRFLTARPERPAALASGIVFLLVELLYVWVVSVGKMSAWPDTSFYFDQQANAFLSGQIALLESPPPELKALSDPYELSQRKDIAYIWDVTYYDGKYYLYWGPAPALILSAVKALHPAQIGDQAIVFAATSGAFLFSSLLLLALWKRFFRGLSWKLVPVTLLVAGLANPMPWLLSRPSVYEATIAGGQCFLLAGLYWAFTALNRERPIPWRLILAGVSWSLAAGSRTTLAPVVVFLGAAVLWRIYRSWPGERRAGLPAALALTLPLALGAGGLAWYNAVRFGSVLEFGHRFQLTGIDLQSLYQKGHVFSAAYLLPNLYSYLVRPLTFKPVFPFVFAPWINQYMWPFFIHLPPDYYYPEPLNGALFSAPFLWLAALPLYGLLRKARGALSKDAFYTWWVVCLAGAALLAFAPLLLFYSSSMRYLADVVPTLALLASLGFWEAHQASRKRGLVRPALLLLAIATIVLGFALGFTGYNNRFEALNPALYSWLLKHF